VVIARQPANDLINFFFSAIFAFRFLNIQRINLCKFHRENVILRHRHFSFGRPQTLDSTACQKVLIALPIKVEQAAKVCRMFLQVFSRPMSHLVNGSILPRVGGSFMPCFFRQFLISA
jgi:hypothetical protein